MKKYCNKNHLIVGLYERTYTKQNKRTWLLVGYICYECNIFIPKFMENAFDNLKTKMFIFLIQK